MEKEIHFIFLKVEKTFVLQCLREKNGKSFNTVALPTSRCGLFQLVSQIQLFKSSLNGKRQEERVGEEEQCSVSSSSCTS